MNTQSQTAVRYISKPAAQKAWRDLCKANGISLRSITARCLFEQTRSSRGNLCQFGLTPLWDNELRKNLNDEVLYSEFVDMAQRLLDAGQTRQEARKA